MSNSTTSGINPKLAISQFFDSLIAEIDIFTEEQLAFYECNSYMKIKDYENDDDNNDDDRRNIDQNNLKDEITEYIDNIHDTATIEDYFKNDGTSNIWFLYREIIFHVFDFTKNLPSKTVPPKTMLAFDYMNAARDKLFDVLNQFQKETFERYEKIKNELKRDGNNNNESIIERLFENRYAFILKIQEEDSDGTIIQEAIHLIELDFYLNSEECQLLR